jgi:peroxisomal 2,4-dienoyl-CoA reductase
VKTSDLAVNDSRNVFRESILAGRVALVTGGATGIGKRIAFTLGRHGAAIAICSRKEEVLKGACAELEAEGIDALYVVADVRDARAVEQVIERTLAKHGRLDIVVNNAAGNFPAKLDDISYNGFKTIVDIDLLGTYNVSKAAYHAWLGEHGGAIVNITAPFEHWGVPFQAHVAAAKTGVNSLTRTCAAEWAEKGIRVNAVAPGFVAETEGVKRFEEVRKSGDNSLKGTKQDIANAVLFLVSDAAGFISGECIRVDGSACVNMFRSND